MKRRLFYGALLAVLALNLFVGARVYFSSAHGSETDEAYPILKLFSTVLQRVRPHHVDTQGEFGGVGIVISMKDNFLTVVAPMDDTPGFRAGILSGDRIVKIDGRSAEKLSLPDAVKKLRGEPGTEVGITLFRPSTGQMKDYKLTRAQIKVDSVKDINGHREFPLSENNVGYVRLV